ncbi:MAG: hypothetical protein JXA03_08825 [Bacteroidales bacterium]|nr:hypothetical protein [Bacteroidales bacterium]
MVKNVFLSVSLLCIFVIDSEAQCCSAGNPYFYSEQAGMGHKDLQVMAGYKYSASTTYYSGSGEIEINDIDKAWFNYLNLQMVYGLTPRLSVQTELGYFINKSEDYYKPDWETKTGYGPGDITMTVKYLAYKNFIHKFSILPSVGMKFPVGVFDQTVDHVKLPITLQPSSGSYRYQVNLYTNKTFKNPKWNLGFFGSFEYAQLIDSQNFYYKYGNIYLFSLIGSYKVLNNFNLGLEIRSENRDKAKRENNQIVASTGYNIVYSIPHLRYSFLKKWLLAANSELPVYRFYNGIQLGNQFAVSLSLSYRISFDKQVLNEVEFNN